MNSINSFSMDAFLKDNDFDITGKTDKEKLKMLKEIKFKSKIDRDYEELKYSQNKEYHNEYIKNLQIIDARIVKVQDYILLIKYQNKERKVCKIKAPFQKVMRYLKK